jgi:hypothetical protein
LKVVQPSIETAAAEQLVVGTGLDDPAFTEHDDPIGMADRGQPVSDDEYRAILHQPVDRLLDQALRLGIEGTGRLIEDENR